ncbi:hypothetical protein DMP17_43475 [Pseudonocardia sp. TMWB2A]|uniref:glycoside hydrolase family 16 protein n=1 Tax=Pseudonocardia sp. TMWB2A TaxID=687430 RepID=UPI00307D2E95
MTADELEQLLKSLLAKGVTVVLLALGPAGELVGVEPGGSATPSVSSGQDAAGAPRPDLELGADGEVCVGSGGSSGAGSGSGSGGSGAGSGGSGSGSGSGSDSSGGGDGRDGSGSDGSSAGSGSAGAGDDSSGGSEDGRDGGAGGSDSSDGSGDSDDRRRSSGSGDSGSNSGSDDSGSGGDSSGKSGSQGTGSGDSGGSGSDDSSPGDSDAGSGSGGSGTASGAPDESGATAYGTSDDAAAGLLTGGTGTGGRTTPAPCPTGSGGAADPAPATESAPEAGGAAAAEGTTAAAKLGWGQPVRTDEFDNGTDGWSIYDGAGHAGNGRRTPDAAAVADGVLTITGDSQGNTAGMAWKEGSQQYGRWEGRVRAPVGDPSYNALLLLWPTAENWPEGGELDFMEMMDPSRQKTNAFFHYGADNSQVEGSVEIDATQWHNWALEWTPDRITAYVDGEKWFETTEQKVQPPGPMHLCIQLDWFPKGGSGKETQMQVDWVRQYTLDGGAAGTGTGSGQASSGS